MLLSLPTKGELGWDKTPLINNQSHTWSTSSSVPHTNQLHSWSVVLVYGQETNLTLWLSLSAAGQNFQITGKENPGRFWWSSLNKEDKYRTLVSLLFIGQSIKEEEVILRAHSRIPLDPNTKSLYVSTDYRLKFYEGGEEQHAELPQAEQLQMLKKIWEHFRLSLLSGV